MKYIDADKIRNAIESEADNWNDVYTDCMRDNLLIILDSLQQEQPEVDLEKEVTKFVQSKEFIESKESPVLLTARYFAEWGAIHFNARKEE